MNTQSIDTDKQDTRDREVSIIDIMYRQFAGLIFSLILN